MRKSKDISKYNLDWQVVRVLAKDFKSVEEKCAWVRNFFDNYACKANWERVVNYLEGLHHGYRKRNEKACQYIEKQIATYGVMADYDVFDIDSSMNWNEKQLRKCYKDNMKRYTNYCKKGYFHKEIYEFVQTFDFADNDLIEDLREEANGKDNEHHFFF